MQLFMGGRNGRFSEVKAICLLRLYGSNCNIPGSYYRTVMSSRLAGATYIFQGEQKSIQCKFRDKTRVWVFKATSTLTIICLSQFLLVKVILTDIIYFIQVIYWTLAISSHVGCYNSPGSFASSKPSRITSWENGEFQSGLLEFYSSQLCHKFLIVFSGHCVSRPEIWGGQTSCFPKVLSEGPSILVEKRS